MRVGRKWIRECHALPWYAERRRGSLKLCTYCKPPQWREVEEFTTHPLTRDGLDNRCNFCRSAYRREQKRLRRERVLMLRCKHGFHRSIVPCIECDSAERGVPVPALEAARPRAAYRRQSNPGRRLYRCAACGQHGHSKRTCSKNRPDDAPSNASSTGGSK